MALPRPTWVRTAPMLAAMTRVIARASVMERVWLRTRKPHDGGDGRFEAHEDGEGGGGQAAEGEEFEGVGEHGGEDGDGGAQGDRGRVQQFRARLDEAERQEQYGRDDHGERQPVGLREASARTGAEDDVRGPHGAYRQGERDADRVEAVEASAAEEEDAAEGKACPRRS